jgi:hypothetical protein
METDKKEQVCIVVSNVPADASRLPSGEKHKARTLPITLHIESRYWEDMIRVAMMYMMICQVTPMSNK